MSLAANLEWTFAKTGGGNGLGRICVPVAYEARFHGHFKKQTWLCNFYPNIACWLLPWIIILPRKTCTSLTQHWNSKFHLTQTSAVQDVTINSWKAITNFTSSTVEQWNGEGGCNESLDRSVLDGTLFDLCTEGTKNVILRSGSVRRGVILRATVEGKLQSAMRSHI